MDKKIKAVLFDMDGVLVDSMAYHYISWFEALRKYDVRVTPMDVFEMEGAKWDKVIRFAFKREKKKLDEKTVDKIFNERKKLFAKHFKRYIFTGMPELLKTLRARGFKIGLVTGSALYEAKNMLPRNIYCVFDTIVAGDMVKRGKPFPDPYLLAAKNLGVSSCECLVIENAPYGIKSARAAKMKCFAIATSLPEECLFEADKIFAAHKELDKYFKSN